MKPNLTVIQGGAEDSEKLFQKLLADPTSFTDEEFRTHTEAFKDKISLALYADLFQARLIAVPFTDPLMNRIFLATLDGEDDEADGLLEKMLRHDELGLTRVK
ncbi:hypothetical protein LP417_35240 (plasmid) [Polaromonas sp. P1-6]|nr:hypothetical protein LP417_35240 [Polaromonas sp. P1-6]